MKMIKISLRSTQDPVTNVEERTLQLHNTTFQCQYTCANVKQKKSEGTAAKVA